ncbi:AAA family ATPase [Pseudomonas graminis]
MAFSFSIPVEGSNKEFIIESGQSIIFVGANGGGKTRLAVQVETSLGEAAHRISAHRALSMNPSVNKISEKKALAGLRYGHPDISFQNRNGHRWEGKGAIKLLNDYDYLIQLLFADQANTTQLAYERFKPDSPVTNDEFKLTKLDQLNTIWKRLLPHRILHITSDDISVSVPGSESKYNASEMSDGERAIFYMIGQVLTADHNQVLIIDEPELHIHRSIMSKLWDELEAARPDCGFIFITHDLEFAAARTAQKYVIRDYNSKPCWTIEDVPQDSGFSEEIATLILGSRKPVLFVEGDDKQSLDLPLYRACYPEWTVIPRSSCTEVIHSVNTMRKNAAFTRIRCSGIVDADDYDESDKSYHSKRGVEVLPVVEIENLILLPDVSRAILEIEGYSGDGLTAKLKELSDAIFSLVSNSDAIEQASVRYCLRRIDRMLKKIDLSAAKTITAITEEYQNKTVSLDIAAIGQSLVDKITHAVEQQDLTALLSCFDHKGMLNKAALILRGNSQKSFESWLIRELGSTKESAVRNAIQKSLPVITAS